MGKKTGKVGFQLIDTLGDGFNQRSGFSTSETGRAQGLNLAIEFAAHRLFDPGCSCRRLDFHHISAEAAPCGQQNQYRSKRSYRRRPFAKHDDTVAGRSQQACLKNRQQSDGCSKCNDRQQKPADTSGLGKQPLFGAVILCGAICSIFRMFSHGAGYVVQKFCSSLPDSPWPVWQNRARLQQVSCQHLCPPSRHQSGHCRNHPAGHRPALPAIA